MNLSTISGSLVHDRLCVCVSLSLSLSSPKGRSSVQLRLITYIGFRQVQGSPMEGAVGRGGRCDRHHGLQASIRPKFGMYSLKSSVGSRQYRNGGVIPMQCARPLLSARNKRAGDCNKEGRTPLWRLSKSSSKRYSRLAHRAERCVVLLSK